MNVNGYSPEDLPGAPPIRGHGDQGYNTACHFAAHGILAALLHRDRTGAGQYVDCSMHEALSCTVEVGMPYYLYMRQDVVRQTARHAAARPTEPWLFHAGDGKDLILFGVGRDNASWKKLKAWLQSRGFGIQLVQRHRRHDQRCRGRVGAEHLLEHADEVGGGRVVDRLIEGGQRQGLPQQLAQARRLAVAG